MKHRPGPKPKGYLFKRKSGRYLRASSSIVARYWFEIVVLGERFVVPLKTTERELAEDRACEWVRLVGGVDDKEEYLLTLIRIGEDARRRLEVRKCMTAISKRARRRSG